MATLLALLIYAQLGYVAFVVSSAFHRLLRRQKLESVGVIELALQLFVVGFAGVAIEILRGAEVYAISPWMERAWQASLSLLIIALCAVMFARLLGVRGRASN